MLDAALLNPAHAILVLGLLWVRCMVCIGIAPLFGLIGMPRSLKLAVATVLAAALWPLAGGLDDISQVPQSTQPEIVLLLLKDAAIGFLLGFTLALPSWMAEGIGAMFDNQRGAMTGQTFNPLLNSPSTMASLLQYATIMVLFESGGLRWVFEYMALVARVWPPHALLPPANAFDQETLILLFNGMARGSLLYFAPLMAVMALMEMAMAIISVYAPHMQAFQLSMPLKSLVGLLVLTLLLGLMFDLWSQDMSKYLRDLIEAAASALGGQPPGRR
jgi:type III secretion protein T